MGWDQSYVTRGVMDLYKYAMLRNGKARSFTSISRLTSPSLEYVVDNDLTERYALRACHLVLPMSANDASQQPNPTESSTVTSGSNLRNRFDEATTANETPLARLEHRIATLLDLWETREDHYPPSDEPPSSRPNNTTIVNLAANVSTTRVGPTISTTVPTTTSIATPDKFDAAQPRTGPPHSATSDEMEV
ncbi:hypothetical protein ZOSMA_50G00080 [Zostera marina]|uniref:Uncharacterized protein n=1 Tax=Zostera marina TaxID=29655 RepID=A0A0K9NXX0_ZOSMR|nr:hypothetical protein ZOSMA_50G00080 [Zostera marina]